MTDAFRPGSGRIAPSESHNGLDPIVSPEPNAHSFFNMTPHPSAAPEITPVLPLPTNPPASDLLSGSHRRTYDAIFRHPAAHNLQWHDVHALFRHLGQLETEANGNLKVTRHGQTLVLHPPRTKDVSDTDELLSLRHFLERSATAAPPAAAVHSEAHCLMVIDHHEARIFRLEMEHAKPQRILPHQPTAHFRHGPNSKDFSHGQEKPDPTTFFGAVLHALPATGGLLIFGSGTGGGSEMEQFVTWVKSHHRALAARIVGTVKIDAHHMNDGELLQKAQEYYANPPPAGP